MTNNQIANSQATLSSKALITDSIANGKNVPVIAITGGVITFAFIGVLAYAIYKGVHTKVNVGKDGFTVSFEPEPDLRLTYMDDSIGINDVF